MTLYTFYSPSHATMFWNFLLPGVKPVFAVAAARFSQECATGVYMTQGWGAAMRRKMTMLSTACRTQKEPFVYSDVDVVCDGFTPEQALTDLGDSDLACMHNGWGDYCAGFMVIRPGELMAKLFESTLEKMDVCDQPALNECLKDSVVTRKRLPEEIYLSYGLLHAKNPELVGLDLMKHLPETVKVFHANYLIGIEEKEKIMAAAKNAMSSRHL